MPKSPARWATVRKPRFARTFKKAHGIGPGEYRKTKREAGCRADDRQPIQPSRRAQRAVHTRKNAITITMIGMTILPGP